MILKSLLISALLLSAFCQENSEIIYPECDGSDNLLPILEATPQLINQTANGKRFLLQNGSYEIMLGVFNGTPYEVGYAMGQLFGYEINACLENMIDYVVAQADQWINSLPPELHWLKYLPLKAFFQGALEVTDLDTYYHTPPEFDEQFHGIADGANINYKMVMRMNLFPELIKAACTIIGAWGPATAEGHLIQMRALDWDPTAPMSQFPMITVYQSTANNSNQYANFGWAGMIGTLAGFSSKTAICEKVWLPEMSNDSSRAGTPWMYVLRDVLQYAEDLSDAIDMIGTANRTCQIYVGVGSLADNEARIMEYSAKDLVVWTDTNYSTPYTVAHPQMDGIVYLDKHVQPSNDTCLGATLQGNYGMLDSEYLFQTSAAQLQTGDTLLAVYDFYDQIAYLAYPEYPSGVPAYERSMMILNMTQLYNL